MNISGGYEICTGSPPHVGRKHCAAVLKFSITVSMLDLGVSKRKHQVLPEYKIFVHKILT